jgi:hypothetical protein
MRNETVTYTDFEQIFRPDLQDFVDLVPVTAKTLLCIVSVFEVRDLGFGWKMYYISIFPELLISKAKLYIEKC